MNTDQLEKEAQQRNLLKQIWRQNPMEQIRYHGFESYRRVYDAITDVDNDIRDVAKAEKQEFRDMIHQARMAMKNREYPKVMYYAYKVFELVDGIFYRIKDLIDLRKEMISDYYEQSGMGQDELAEMERGLGKKPNQKSDLAKGPVQVPKAADLKVLLYTTAAPEPGTLLTEATAQQWIQENMPSYRQMEGSILDRIFRNKMGKQKEAARQALRMAERLFSSVPEVFKKLDSARTDFSVYVGTAEKFQQDHQKQKDQLAALYQEHFAQTVDEMREQTPAEQVPVAQVSVDSDEAARQADIATTVEPDPGAAAAQGDVEAQQAAEQAAQEAAGQVAQQQQVQPAQTTAAYVVELVQRAKFAARDGDRRKAGALLIKASEICDEHGAEEQATNLLIMANEALVAQRNNQE